MSKYESWTISKLKSLLKELEEGGQGVRDLIFKNYILQLIESKRGKQ